MEQMLRIECEDSTPSRTTLRLAGTLGARDLEVLRGSVAPLLGRGREVEMDLTALRFLDEPGARCLCALRERGVSLSRAVGYVAELLRVVENER